jgi:hypothetical protein
MGQLTKFLLPSVVGAVAIAFIASYITPFLSFAGTFASIVAGAAILLSVFWALGVKGSLTSKVLFAFVAAFAVSFLSSYLTPFLSFAGTFAAIIAGTLIIWLTLYIMDTFVH